MRFAVALAAILTAMGTSSAGAATYDVTYRAELVPERGRAVVTLVVEQDRALLSTLDFSAPAVRYEGFEGDGDVTVSGDRVHWELPPRGGSLTFEHVIDHKRGSRGAYDAIIEDDWALGRLDDLFPPARTVARKDARASARVAIEAPEGWSVETPYGPAKDRPIAFENPERRFDRPTGWLVAGKIGVRRSTIADRKVAVAAPVGEGFRRRDVLAFLRWTMPTLVSIFPSFPDRLLIVGAGDPMWRGGLSGPTSFYIHSDRPLLSENDTSTILHELVHIATGMRAKRGHDWIVEGLAEFYSVEVLRRSGTITQRRYGNAIRHLSTWSNDVNDLRGSRSQGAKTARAVLLFHDLDLEIRQATGSRRTLDGVARELVAADEPVSLDLLAGIVRKAIGRDSEVLSKVGSE